jgi:hypothetical protein
MPEDWMLGKLGPPSETPESGSSPEARTNLNIG